MWKFDKIRLDNGEELTISGNEERMSVVADGPDKGSSLSDLLSKLRETLLGARNFSRFGLRFPLLMKYVGKTIAIRHVDESQEEIFVADITPASSSSFNIQDLHGMEEGLLPRRYSVIPDIPVNIMKSQSFTINILCIDCEVMRDYSEKDTFVIIMALEGEARLICDDKEMHIHVGQTALISALAKGLEIIPDGEFTALEAYL